MCRAILAYGNAVVSQNIDHRQFQALGFRLLSGASQAEVKLTERNGRILLEVCDSGSGFEPANQIFFDQAPLFRSQRFF